MGKSRASKLNGYRSAVSRQRNDVYKFKTKRGKKNKSERSERFAGQHERALYSVKNGNRTGKNGTAWNKAENSVFYAERETAV